VSLLWITPYFFYVETLAEKSSCYIAGGNRSPIVAARTNLTSGIQLRDDRRPTDERGPLYKALDFGLKLETYMNNDDLLVTSRDLKAGTSRSA
jgi:hypothetical protein